MGLQARVEMQKRIKDSKQITPDIMEKVAQSGDLLNNALIDYMSLRARAPDMEASAKRDYIRHCYSMCTRNMDIRAPAYAYYLQVRGCRKRGLESGALAGVGIFGCRC